MFTETIPAIPLPQNCPLCAPPLPPRRRASPELALDNYARWPAHVRRLRVRFLGGVPSIHDQIRAIEAGPDGWNSASALQFVFDGNADAELRVSMETGASWSHMGVVAAGLPEDVPSMNLALTAQAGEGDVRRVWLHEAGHALGMIHEHLSPNAHIPWLKERVYAAYWERARWDRETVDAQVFAVYAASQVTAGPADAYSIMMYWISADWVADGVERGGSDRLSRLDRATVAQWYGPPPAQWRRTYFPMVAA